jgi:Leucine-rich repeat (LRR) protein
MNNYITTNIILLTKFKLFNFSNYFWKLLLIQKFNYLKSKNYKSDYKIFININKIIKDCELNYNIGEIINIERLEICRPACLPRFKFLKNTIEDKSFIIKRYLNDLTIPKFINLPNLIYFDIAYFALDFIPIEFGKFINLNTLYLSDNKIKLIPRNFENLINLKYFYIEGNYIKIIPKQIGNLINLIEFNISYNKIKIIPKEIGNLINLEKFYINDNDIKKIPKNIKKLINLGVLIW